MAHVDPQWIGAGEEFDEGRVQQAVDEVQELVDRAGRSRSVLDEVEGKAAAVLYDALSPQNGEGPGAVPVFVLDDPGFWRYLSVKWFWEFIQWRQWKTPENYDEGKHFVYLSGEPSVDCVLTRMYIRMTAVGGSEHADLAACLRRATDFWRSHIVRVRTAGAPPVVRAMVRSQRERHLNTPKVRELAKRVNRTWSNIVLDLYDDAEADALIAELKSGLG